jgi:hypothetical protein
VRNGMGERVRVWAVLKRSWGHGRATWPRIPTNVREGARWSTTGAGKAGLAGRSHGVARERVGAQG